MVKICPVCSWMNEDITSYCVKCNAYLQGPIIREIDVPYPPLVPRLLPPLMSCAYHHTIPAIASCYICKRPICINCTRSQGALALCLECATKNPYYQPVIGALPPTHYLPTQYR